jgi:GTP-binding protein
VAGTVLRIRSADFVRAAHDGRSLLQDGLPELAFAGRSNVGKSSLMNALAGRKGLARTSSTPGRTRSINYFLINRRLHFVDLPGYGWAKAGRRERRGWGELVERYLGQLAEREDGGEALVLQLVDAKVGATASDLEAYRYLVGFGLPVLVVATKVDQVGRGARGKALSEIRDRLELTAGGGLIPVSARTGEGIKELWTTIDRHLWKSKKSKHP